MTLVRGRLVLPDEISPGWVRIRGATIAEVGLGEPPPQPAGVEVLDVGDDLVLPGLVDVHCHGGSGHSFDLGIDSALAAAEFHWRAGTTSLLASLGTTSHSTLLDQVRALTPAVTDGQFIGVHLEGPYLSPVRCGAHPVELLKLPDWAELSEVLAAAPGSVSMVTIAAELPGAIGVIEALARAGVVVGLGHTDATGEQTRAGIEAGARIGTHLFNGMRPIHHREGGPAVALMADERVGCELICDGHHVSAEVCSFTYRSVGRDRLILITDACPAAGMPDGRYRLGNEDIVASGGAIHTADGRSLCGSALTLMAAVRFAVSCGIPLVDAVRAASYNPARAMGALDRGELAAGMRADLVLTDPDLALRRVLRGGRWL